MALTISDIQISKIHIIDDDPEGRNSYGFAVEEMDVESFLQEDKVESLDKFFLSLKGNDAVISDHHLKKVSSYFPVNGAEFISQCYDKHIPSILVTRYEDSYNEIRPFKKNIPVVLNPADFNPDSLFNGLLLCINEFKGLVSPARKIWRTLVRIEDADEKTISIILPSWNRNIVIELERNEMPAEISHLAIPDSHFYASVNIDAEDSCELFFQNWEVLKK